MQQPCAAVPPPPSRDTIPSWRPSTALLVLLAAGALPRLWNLAAYPMEMGFDAWGNWDYIAMLLGQWRLPAAGEGWSTAHPPFFYFLAAAVGRLTGVTDRVALSHLVVALCGLLGLASIAAVALYVRRSGPRAARASLLAAALLLFLPVHVYMSAMLGEEVLASALVTFALVGLAAELQRPEGERSSAARPLVLGVVAGLALLTKLSAAPAIAAATAVLALEGPCRGWKRSLASAAAFAGAAALAGGWFYLRNLLENVEAYPHGLAVHALMFDMPPGSRTVADYFRITPDAFRASEAMDAGLLHSVWGGTWASIWFDTHRHFLPLHPTRGLELFARLLLVLGLVPAAAFATGLVGGAKRAVLDASGPDRLLVGTTVLTLAGYVAFTWANPWYACVKGSYLLPLVAPYAIYAATTLDAWMGASRGRTAAVLGALALLSLVASVTFSYNALFVKQMEYPGTPGEAPSPPRDRPSGT